MEASTASTHVDLIEGIPDLDTLIKAFNTPSLTHFALITTTYGRMRDHHIGSSLIECLRQSRCNLRTLRISAPNIPLSSNSQWISDLIDFTPELRTLHLEFCAPKESEATAGVSVMLNSVVYWLCSSPAPTLPSLSTLTVRTYKFPTDKSSSSVARDMATALLHMVESRADSNTSLRHAELVISHSFFRDHRPGARAVGNIEDVEELEAFKVDVARRRELLLVKYGVTFDLDISWYSLK
ncbi:hypothetical protein PQX77_016668 [Marasmius sp. AFHP31]|nr:hypothetical protein PQX77_016668 [Marasmius sp. AFHP31]